MTYDEENTMIAENIANKIIISAHEQEIATLKDEIETLQILTSNTEAGYKIRELKYEVKTLKTKLEQIEEDEQEDDDYWNIVMGSILGMVIGVILAGVIF